MIQLEVVQVEVVRVLISLIQIENKINKNITIENN